MLKHNLDPYGESTARMEGFGLGQAGMVASRNRLEAGRQDTNPQLDAYFEHGGHGGLPIFPAVASAQLAQVDEVVQPKRQRDDHPVPQRADDVMPLVFEQGV